MKKFKPTARMWQIRLSNWSKFVTAGINNTLAVKHVLVTAKEWFFEYFILFAIGAMVLVVLYIMELEHRDKQPAASEDIIAARQENGCMDYTVKVRLSSTISKAKQFTYRDLQKTRDDCKLFYEKQRVLMDQKKGLL
jgi:hypothetical protein